MQRSKSDERNEGIRETYDCLECELELVESPSHSTGPFHNVCPGCGKCRDCEEGNV